MKNLSMILMMGIAGCQGVDGHLTISTSPNISPASVPQTFVPPAQDPAPVPTVAPRTVTQSIRCGIGPLGGAGVVYNYNIDYYSDNTVEIACRHTDAQTIMRAQNANPPDDTYLHTKYELGDMGYTDLMCMYLGDTFHTNPDGGRMMNESVNFTSVCIYTPTLPQ